MNRARCCEARYKREAIIEGKAFKYLIDLEVEKNFKPQWPGEIETEKKSKKLNYKTESAVFKNMVMAYVNLSNFEDYFKSLRLSFVRDKHRKYEKALRHFSHLASRRRDDKEYRAIYIVLSSILTGRNCSFVPTRIIAAKLHYNIQQESIAIYGPLFCQLLFSTILTEGDDLSRFCSSRIKNLKFQNHELGRVNKDKIELMKTTSFNPSSSRGKSQAFQSHPLRGGSLFMPRTKQSTMRAISNETFRSPGNSTICNVRSE